MLLMLIRALLSATPYYAAYAAARRLRRHFRVDTPLRRRAFAIFAVMLLI